VVNLGIKITGLNLNQFSVKSIIAKITRICHKNHLHLVMEKISATIIRRRRRSGKTFKFINGSIFVVTSSEMFLEMLSEHSSGQKD